MDTKTALTKSLCVNNRYSVNYLYKLSIFEEYLNSTGSLNEFDNLFELFAYIENTGLTTHFIEFKKLFKTQVFIDEIVFGPNVRNAEKWKPYFQYKLNKMWDKHTSKVDESPEIADKRYIIRNSEIKYLT